MDRLNYKKLNISLESYASSHPIHVIGILNKEFFNDEIHFEIQNNELIIFLRELDVNRLNSIIQGLKMANSIPEFEKQILNKIVEKIESIKSYGIKNGKRIYIDYYKERKVINRKQKELARGKYFYAKTIFTPKNNNVPDKYLNKIICDDSEKVLGKLPKNCIDLIFTSPPYNFGLDYENHRDGIDWNSYFEKLFKILKKCIRVLKHGGRLAINIQPLFSDYIPIHHMVSDFLMKKGLIWKAEIIWEKHNYNCKYTAWGSWKSPSNPYFKYTWEFIEIFCKGDIKHEGDPNNIDISAEEFKNWVYAKWDIAPERNMKEWGHPAMFPEELAKRIIRLFTYKGDVVLDPFNGVGTTTKVAKILERKYIGIDISEEYCKKAENRLNEVDSLLLKAF